MALITEDRKGEGLLLDQSISANLALGNLPTLARHGVIDRRREEALARRQVEALRVRCATPRRRWANCPAATSRRW